VVTLLSEFLSSPYGSWGLNHWARAVLVAMAELDFLPGLLVAWGKKSHQ